MKIFRWVLSNIVLLVVVWSFVYAYLNWDELKDDMPDSVNNLVARFQHDESQAAVTGSGGSPVMEHGHQPPRDEQAVSSAEESAGTQAVIVEEIQSVEIPVPQAEEKAMGEAAGEDVAVLSDSEPPQVAQEQAAVEGATLPIPEEGEGARPVQKHEFDDIVRSELIQAREAFWNRDLAKAETLYSDLAAKRPEHSDILGELGNVYLAQNKVKEAADAYYKAAELLIDEGRLRQVGQLMGIIQMADPDKARVLDKKMRELYQQTRTVR